MPTSTGLCPRHRGSHEQASSGGSNLAVADIFGREAQCARIERFLDDCSAGSQALLIEGEAGIGKSSLWDLGVAAARRRGVTVLSCRALASEGSLAFSDLSDLLAPLPDALLGDLPPPQASALGAARLRTDAGPEAAEPRAVGAATLGVVRKLATGARVLIAVDDWPLLDSASAAVLEYVLRRVAGEPVGLLATARSDDAAEAFSSLECALAPRVLERVAVEALDLGAFGEMFESKGALSVRGPELMRLHAASGGNPMFGLELLAALADSSGELPLCGSLPRPFPVPASSRPLLRRRLDTVPASVREMILALAAAPQPSVELCVSVCGDRRRAENALDAAEAAGILEVVDEDVRFTHPLLRSLAYSGATQRQRRRAHLSLAGASEPGERARHQALAADGPDAPLASELDAAADAAHERGAAHEACELADLALSLTPPEHREDRFRRLLAAGRLHLSAFDPDGAKRILEEAVALSRPGPARADALYRLATAVRYSEGATARRFLERALDEAGETGVLRASIHRDLGLVLAAQGSPAGAKHYRDALAIARGAGDPALVAQMVALQALVEFCAGNGVRRDLIDAALVECPAGERVAMELRPPVVVSHVLRFSDDLAGARSLLLAEYEKEAEEGARTDLPFLLVWLVELETWAGNFEAAEHYAEQGYGAAIVSGAVSPLAFMRGSRALLRAWQGRESEAREDAASAIADAKRCDAYQPLVNATHALGLLELAGGDPAAAHEALGPMTRVVIERGPLDPGWWGFRMLPDDVEALIRLGRLDEAHALLAPFEERARTLGRRWAIAAAGRCRALLASAEGCHETAARALSDSFSAHGQVDQPHELARTHLVAAEVARRGRRKLAARNHAQTARNIFERIGASAWVSRADEELGRLGGERSGRLELTATERRVAQLVASGRTNREVAAELYMGLRTVEAHLSHAYRKVGVRSRSELARWWVERAEAMA